MRHASLLFSFAMLGAVCGLRSAAAQQHWSYQAITRPLVPTASQATWGTSPLDRLVLAKMNAHGLSPSPRADRATWLRRVSLDLTGLPPTPTALATFLTDHAEGANERVVDRLLTSSAFAERWAAWWLDLARYADSQGYEKDDLRRTMWRYRDWVIDAFARDLPFDQFTIEQLAGDLLPNATDEQRLATAFHRQTMTNTEGGTDDEEFRVAAVVDRVDTTMSVWMGSTLGCAQCHDHKYDPFSQREFFQIFAFFDQTEDRDQDNDAPTLRVPSLPQRAAQKAIELELTALRPQLVPAAGAVEAWAVQQRQNVRAFASAAPTASIWQVLGPIAAGGMREAHTTALAPETDGVQVANEQAGQRWRAEPEYVDGRVHTWSGDGSAVYLHRTIHALAAAPAALSLGSDDAIKVWWNGREVLAKEVGRGAAADQELLAVDLLAGDNTVLLKISNGGGPSGFYFDLRGSDLPTDVLTILALAPDACDGAQHERLRREYVARAPELAALRSRLAELEAAFDAERGPAVPVLRELPAAKRRTTRVHRRGSFLDQGDAVTADVPRVWPGLVQPAGNDRLAFARWLVSRDNPLTARVVANRIWSELFGAGLVPTLEDFGSQGDRPSHPELLDWLAMQFMDRGWSLRELLKTIVLSATYGQSSAVTAQHRERDPENRWLARGASLRLGAEALRDQALQVSGLLVRTVGGPSVMPPQPDGVWMQPYSGEKWSAADGPDRFRRALYTFWRRTSPHPAMLVFDAQSRESCVLRRQRTNTPLQALVLWNDPQFHEPAGALAARVLANAGTDDTAQVRWLWQQCLLREPTVGEQSRLLALLAAERQHFAVQPELVAAMVASGRHGAPAELASWTVVASVVLALDEFVSKQ